MTIVNLRGTHGSGKSTVAYRLLAKYPHRPVQALAISKKPLGYRVELPGGKSLGIIGPYTTACGGCDAVQPYSSILLLLARAAKECDHVFFEGALVSTTYGSLGQHSERYGPDFVFAFMDTPLADCVSRVNARREAAGKGPLEDTKNIVGKWNTIDRLRMKLETGTVGAAQRTAIIRHESPTKDVLALLGVRIPKEPS
jgi:hypothetical protein